MVNITDKQWTSYFSLANMRHCSTIECVRAINVFVKDTWGWRSRCEAITVTSTIVEHVPYMKHERGRKESSNLYASTYAELQWCSRSQLFVGNARRWRIDCTWFYVLWCFDNTLDITGTYFVITLQLLYWRITKRLTPVFLKIAVFLVDKFYGSCTGRKLQCYSYRSLPRP